MTLRAMLIEDEANILEAVRFLLSRDGWEVFGHGNGASAIEEIERRAPHVIVLDVMLPGRTGLEILHDLRSRDDDLARIPVLMLTAKGQDSDRERALALGANGYLTKPFANDELVETVRSFANIEKVASGAGGAG